MTDVQTESLPDNTATEMAASPSPKKPRHTPLLSLVALLLAALSIVASAWLYWQVEQNAMQQSQWQTQLDQLASQLTARQAALDDLTRQQAQLSAGVNAQAEQTSRLAARLSDQQDAMQSFAEQLTQVNPNPDNAWLIAQTRGLLRLAEQQAQLANDTLGAVALLKQARDTLASAGDPRYFATLQAIDTEVLALQSLEQVDLASQMSRLQALIGNIDQLPLTPLQANQQAASEQSSNWQWLTSLVAVSRFDETQAQVVAPEPWIKAALTAQLEQAKTLLLLRDEAAFNAQIGQIQDWLQVYVASSPARQAWQEQLQSMQGLPLSLTLPTELGKARRLLDGLEAL